MGYVIIMNLQIAKYIAFIVNKEEISIQREYQRSD